MSKTPQLPDEAGAQCDREATCERSHEVIRVDRKGVGVVSSLESGNNDDPVIPEFDRYHVTVFKATPLGVIRLVQDRRQDADAAHRDIYTQPSPGDERATDLPDGLIPAVLADYLPAGPPAL